MGRAEIRREKREKEKKSKTMILTVEELERYRNQAYEIARKEYLERAEKLNKEYELKFNEHLNAVCAQERQKYIEKYEQLSEEIFEMMLSIPSNVLIGKYWPKTAHKKMPGFVDDCLELYNSWVVGAVTMTEMLELTEKYGKVKLVGIDTATGQTIRERQMRGVD